MKNCFFVVFFTFNSVYGFGQTVYKTPSGNKFHTSTCRFVKNVSNQLSIDQAFAKGLSPCSICKPSTSSSNRISTGGLGIKSNEVKGTSSATQCKGKTKAGARCKRTTKNINGYCFQHES